MIAFEVKDMTCGHCASTITRALKATDAGAKVAIDLARHLVTIEPGSAEPGDLQEAIAEAGYTPVPAALGAPQAAPAEGGSCCGHGR